VAQQNEAVKDSTFGGWDAEEKAGYDERGKRIAALRAELFPVDGTERHDWTLRKPAKVPSANF
jgi:hypothetical protein